MAEKNENLEVFTQLIKVIKDVGKLETDDIDVISSLLFVDEVNFIRCQEVADILNERDDRKFEAKQIAKIIASLVYLREELGRAVYSKTELKDTLPKLFEFNEVPKLASEIDDSSYDKLKLFYTEGYKVERQWHENGLIDVQVDFDSFIDIRPVFIEDNGVSNEDYSIEEMLTVVIFSIAVQDDFGEIKSHSFQMSESGFKSLEKEVLRIRHRLEIAKNTLISKREDK